MAPEEENKRKLDAWIQESTDRFRSLVDHQLAEEKPSRYSHGTWIVAYLVTGKLKPLESSLLDMLTKIEGHETGWPPWLTHLNVARPYPYVGVVECWMKGTLSHDAAHSDF